MNGRALTARQSAILGYMIRFLVEHQHAPSVRAIGAEMGIGSTNGVTDHLRALQRKGFVSRVHGTPTITILRWPDGRRFTLRADSPSETSCESASTT